MDIGKTVKEWEIVPLMEPADDPTPVEEPTPTEEPKEPAQPEKVPV
jgi:hypothetical protein